LPVPCGPTPFFCWPMRDLSPIPFPSISVEAGGERPQRSREDRFTESPRWGLFQDFPFASFQAPPGGAFRPFRLLSSVAFSRAGRHKPGARRSVVPQARPTSCGCFWSCPFVVTHPPSPAPLAVKYPFFLTWYGKFPCPICFPLDRWEMCPGFRRCQVPSKFWFFDKSPPKGVVF